MNAKPVQENNKQQANYTKGENLWDSFIYITTQTIRLWIA